MNCECESNLKIIREQFLDQLMYRGYIDRDNYQLALKEFGVEVEDECENDDVETLEDGNEAGPSEDFEVFWERVNREEETGIV